MEPDVKDNRKVKLSCRNVWKVYGSRPEHFFNSLNGLVDDVNSHAEKIRNDGHIVANADVSFDVHAGEIFVIMGLVWIWKVDNCALLVAPGRANCR